MSTKNISCQSLMQDFAVATGLVDPSIVPRRYLWTDAFAVCNFLELYRQSGDEADLRLALKLVTQVHEVLGKHRADSVHQGWLSGLDPELAWQHPTSAGLRIGKPLNERASEEPADEALEWQQDGQYFHYLTRWMHALGCVARTTGKARYLHWALELATSAHQAFTYTSHESGEKRMYWKMSIDLSRPLVGAMGQHDPLDGLFTYLQLVATAQNFPDEFTLPLLQAEISDMLAMCRNRHWATEDPLGIGGLLLDANRYFQLGKSGVVSGTPTAMDLLHDISISLQAFQQQKPLQLPAGHRLPFRELGLAIGLQALADMLDQLVKHPQQFDHPDQLQKMLGSLLRFSDIQQNILHYWLMPEHQCVSTWLHHADINNVMLATCLAPAGYLGRE